MERGTDRTADAVPATLEHEMRLINEAIALVASGRTRRTVVAGLQLGDQLLPSAQRVADEAGVRLVPLLARRRARRRHRRRAEPCVTSNAPLLLVEDDESLRRIVARHLRGRGYDVEDVASAEDAVRALDAGVRPSLVLLDLNLPGDTGWDLLRGPALAAAGSPPVVIASATTVNPRRLEEFRVAGYLPKPFPLDTLVDTVERLLHNEGANDQP